MTHTSDLPLAIDPRELRKVLSSFVTGVTVVTAVDAQGNYHGVTANSFNSVSLDPPLVLWSQALRAFSHPVYRDARHFAINILSSDQIDVSNRFAKSGEDKFSGIAIRKGLNGVPLIEGCLAYLECSRHAAHEAGDHMIFIGRIDRMECNGSRPLVFGSGRYLVAETHDHARLSKADAQNNRARLHAIRLATHAAVDLSSRLDVTVGVAVWGTHGPTIVHWEPSSQPVSMNLRTGAVLPVSESATGRVFAAWLDQGAVEPVLSAEALAQGASSDSLLQALEEDLQAVRASGNALVSGVSSFVDRENVSVTSASVPVFHTDGSLLAALTILGEAGQVDLGSDSEALRALKATASELTRRFQPAEAMAAG